MAHFLLVKFILSDNQRVVIKQQNIMTEEPKEVKPVVASAESRAKALAHVTALSKNPNIAGLIGKPGYNVFAKLTPALTELANPGVLQSVVDEALKLNDKPETYAVKLPEASGTSSASVMVAAMLAGDGPVKPLASALK
jgi:hypothetical protein